MAKTGRRLKSDLDTKVTIVCYGQVEQRTKRDAQDFYKMCYENSEGHEQLRYGRIIKDLYYGAEFGDVIWGRDICWDGEEIPKGYHRCEYCGSLAIGQDANVLCKDCQETFGHYTIDEL